MAASGNYFVTYFGNSDEYLYLKRNRFTNAYGLDQKFFTFDATGGAYMGQINKVNGALMTLAANPVFKRYAKESNDWRNKDLSEVLLRYNEFENVKITIQVKKLKR